MESKDTTAVNNNCESRVNKFSTYFKNAITTLKLAAIPFMNFTWHFVKPRTSRTRKIFTMNYISKNFIEKELCSLKRNKATGLDELPSGLLKDCAKNISEPLYYIMNLTITLDFSSLLKNQFECSFVSSEGSLQSSNVCFEVRSDNLR